MRRGVAVLLATLVAASDALAQAPPTIRAFDLQTLEDLGRAIYDQDVQAARATDVLLAQRPDLGREGVVGWIVVPAAAGPLVRFLRQRDGAVEAWYDVPITEARAAAAFPTNRGLTEPELAQHRARSLALRNIERACSAHYNTVALRDPQGDAWLVWALAATMKPDVLLVGGHYRFTISADGTTVIARDALSRGCLEISKDAAPQGSQVTGAVVTHLVSDTPIETHVFLSLLHRTPLFVATGPKATWRVANGRIAPLDSR